MGRVAHPAAVVAGHIHCGAVRYIQAGHPWCEFVAENGGPFTYPSSAALVFWPVGSGRRRLIVMLLSLGALPSQVSMTPGPRQLFVDAWAPAG